MLIHLILRHAEWLLWYRKTLNLYLKFRAKLTPFGRYSENGDFQSIFARIASAVTPSEKIQLIRIGSPLQAFQ